MSLIGDYNPLVIQQTGFLFSSNMAPGHGELPKGTAFEAP